MKPSSNKNKTTVSLASHRGSSRPQWIRHHRHIVRRHSVHAASSTPRHSPHSAPHSRLPSNLENIYIGQTRTDHCPSTVQDTLLQHITLHYITLH